MVDMETVEITWRWRNSCDVFVHYVEVPVDSEPYAAVEVFLRDLRDEDGQPVENIDICFIHKYGEGY